MKPYTREELRALRGNEFCDLYADLTGWAATVLTGIPDAGFPHTTLEYLLIIQQKKLVREAIGKNVLREKELMGTV